MARKLSSKFARQNAPAVGGVEYYRCDVAKLSTFIKKPLKSGVEKGKLVQTKGTDVFGSFKLKVDAKKAAAERSSRKPPVQRSPPPRMLFSVPKWLRS